MTPTASTRVAHNPTSLPPSVIPFPDPAEVCVSAVQKTSSRPTKAVPADFTPSRPTTPSPISSGDVRQRKTLRTVMYDSDGRLTGAKIDLATGEVRPKQYKDYFEEGPKARVDPNAFDLEPFWMRMPAAERSTGLARQHDNSKTKLSNGVKIYVQDCFDLDEALGSLPILDDLITGAAQIDLGGNTRPLNHRMLFAMLQHLDYISPLTVRAFMGCSEPHSRKVANCLCVIVTAFVAEAEREVIHR
jgi:hypothetical protein